MLYKAIGIMSGSALDGLDIAYVHFNETAGAWDFEIKYAETFAYTDVWVNKLRDAVDLSALNYQLLHTEYGHYIGREINRFIDLHQLHHQVDLISSHGHTTFHIPEKLMTGQIGDGAAIAAITGLPVISDLRAMDVALGGQGAPIVPVGEKLLFPGYDILLNIGGIANVSLNTGEGYIAFDVCAANRVLNMLANDIGLEYDNDGNVAATGSVDRKALYDLNALEYYGKAYPKSLANNFGVEVIYPMLAGIEINNALSTYVEHIAEQIMNSIRIICTENTFSAHGKKLIVTGGGAFNIYLIERLQHYMNDMNIEIAVPEVNIVKYKEALIMALHGILRWREQTTVMASVTGASKDSIGGAMWIG